jgi:hypothetical protein
MKNTYFSIALIFCLLISHSANALVVWGYNNSAADQEKYRYVLPTNSSGCIHLTRNSSTNFILHDRLDYLSGVGIGVGLSSPACISNINYLNIPLVTPRHVVVAIHWGIWGYVNSLAFIGTNGQVYMANTTPGFTALKTPLGLPTDMGLVALDRDLPAQVVPLHILTPAMQASLNATGAQSFVFGNINTILNITALLGAGDYNYKGIGTNQVLPNSLFNGMPLLSHGITGLFQDPPTAGSTNWNDYWMTQYAPVPPLGTAFPRLYDSGSPTMIKANDARGARRLYLTGIHHDTNGDNYIPGILADLQTQVAAYNASHNKNYVINATSLTAKQLNLIEQAPLNALPYRD